jgi:hypothetical protein
MSDLDVWTVSIMLRTEEGKTRADAFLQGPEVEAECSGWAESPRPPATALGEDLAAASALQDLARCLSDRASSGRPNTGSPDR